MDTNKTISYIIIFNEELEYLQKNEEKLEEALFLFQKIKNFTITEKEYNHLLKLIKNKDLLDIKFKNNEIDFEKSDLKLLMAFNIVMTNIEILGSDKDADETIIALNGNEDFLIVKITKDLELYISAIVPYNFPEKYKNIIAVNNYTSVSPIPINFEFLSNIINKDIKDVIDIIINKHKQTVLKNFKHQLKWRYDEENQQLSLQGRKKDYFFTYDKENNSFKKFEIKPYFDEVEKIMKFQKNEIDLED